MQVKRELSEIVKDVAERYDVRYDENIDGPKVKRSWIKMSLTRIKIWFYDQLNFLQNIWRYRVFLYKEWPFEAHALMDYLEIKLRTMKEYWENEDIPLPYVGMEEDLKDITKAYNALMDLKRLEDVPAKDLFEDIEYYRQKKIEDTNTLFDTLKNYERWWS
jgi:hypothetical protein